MRRDARSAGCAQRGMRGMRGMRDAGCAGCAQRGMRAARMRGMPGVPPMRGETMGSAGAAPRGVGARPRGCAAARGAHTAGGAGCARCAGCVQRGCAGMQARRLREPHAGARCAGRPLAGSGCPHPPARGARQRAAQAVPDAHTAKRARCANARGARTARGRGAGCAGRLWAARVRAHPTRGGSVGSARMRGARRVVKQSTALSPDTGVTRPGRHRLALCATGPGGARTEKGCSPDDDEDEDVTRVG
jgi:hypothetical protein